MALITDTKDFNDIRFLISEDLTATELPDTQIQRDIFLGAAELEILERLKISESEFAGLSETLREKGTIGIKYLCAVLILPSIDLLVSESIEGRSVSYQKVDMKERLERYQTHINNLIPASDGTLTQGVARVFIGKI